MIGSRRDRRAFTLVELLVTVGIVSVLAALLFPVFARAKQGGKLASSKSAMRQIAVASLLYAGSNDDALPNGLGANCYSLIHKYGKYCGTLNLENGSEIPSFWSQMRPLLDRPELFRSDADAMALHLLRESGHGATWWQETEFAGHPGSSYEYALGGPDRQKRRALGTGTDGGTVPLLYSLFVEDQSVPMASQLRLIVSSDLSADRWTATQLGEGLSGR